jgi:hypothetical protein
MHSPKRRIRKLLSLSLTLMLLTSSRPTLAQVPENLKPAYSLDRTGIDQVNLCFRDKHDCEAALKKANSTDWLSTALEIGGGVLAGYFIAKATSH